MAKPNIRKKPDFNGYSQKVRKYPILGERLYIPGQGNVIHLHRSLSGSRANYIRDKRKRSDKRLAYISVRVSDLTKQRLESMASENERSLSWLVDKLLREYIESTDLV